MENRLFQSDYDVLKRGMNFINEINFFYDLVDSIQLKYKYLLPSSTELDLLFGFIVPDKTVENLKYYEPILLPCEIVEEINEAFYKVFKKRVV